MSEIVIKMKLIIVTLLIGVYGSHERNHGDTCDQRHRECSRDSDECDREREQCHRRDSDDGDDSHEVHLKQWCCKGESVFIQDKFRSDECTKPIDGKCHEEHGPCT